MLFDLLKLIFTLVSVIVTQGLNAIQGVLTFFNLAYEYFAVILELSAVVLPEAFVTILAFGIILVIILRFVPFVGK